jgi:hypothetical protein
MLELVLKTDLRVGQVLYYFTSKEKRIYKPCPACDNQRQKEFEHNGHTFKADCPLCTGRQIKGDQNNFISIREYCVESERIQSFRCDDNETFKTNSGTNVSTLKVHTHYPDLQYYVEKREALSVVKELNKIERRKADDFLELEVSHA